LKTDVPHSRMEIADRQVGEIKTLEGTS
jgi:hypothetical protein